MPAKERIQILEESLKRVRRDASRILSEISLPSDIEEIEEVLEEEQWLASSNEHMILDLIRSLAVVATALRTDAFADTKTRLIRLLRDELGEDEWEADANEEVPA
ncbi:MAG: hypothetical protein ACFFH0_05430 [Promethearchaeota archaeon]